MRMRYSIFGLLAATAVVALLVVFGIRSMRPANALHFHNNSGDSVFGLNVFVYPVLTSGSGVWEEFDQQVVLPGESVSFRHDVENASLDFRYSIGDRKIEYANVDISDSTETHLRTNSTGERTGHDSQ